MRAQTELIPSSAAGSGISRHIPVIGDIHCKSPLAYKATRGVVGVTNAVQMAFAEAYINGMELPDSVMRGLFDTCMPIIFKHFPALLTPYEWVLKETPHMAEGSKDLMKIQYDLPRRGLESVPPQRSLHNALYDGVFHPRARLQPA